MREHYERIAKYRFPLEQNAGQLYAALEEKRGSERNEKGKYHSLHDATNGTTKQQAVKQIGKDRSTVNRCAW